MSWSNRLRQAAYTSPSGTRTVFDYENVSYEVDKKGTAFNFPDADGTYVQDLGRTGRRYPLRLIFWGENYDIQTQSFERSLLERGIGVLEHPVYGVVNVVPLGAIKRRDDLKTAGNQSVFDVTFFETTGTIYPIAQSDAQSDVLQSVSAFNNIYAEQLSDSIVLDNATDRSLYKLSFNGQVNGAFVSLLGISGSKDADISNIKDSLLASLSSGDTVVNNVLQLMSLFQTTAKSDVDTTLKIDTFSSQALATTGLSIQSANDFKIKDAFAAGYISGSATSVVNSNFASKPEAILAAEKILDDLDVVTQWRDTEYQNIGQDDTGDGYAALQSMVATAAGAIIDISFSLREERRLVLTRARSVIDIVAELYGDIDENIDFFISTNDLSGSEIIHLPLGREVVYFV